MDDFTNDYGGFISVDDVVCLFQDLINNDIPTGDIGSPWDNDDDSII